MVIDVVAFLGMVLHNRLVILKKHVFDGAHFFPRWAGLPFLATWGHADMLPASTIRGNAKE